MEIVRSGKVSNSWSLVDGLKEVPELCDEWVARVRTGALVIEGLEGEVIKSAHVVFFAGCVAEVFDKRTYVDFLVEIIDGVNKRVNFLSISLSSTCQTTVISNLSITFNRYWILILWECSHFSRYISRIEAYDTRQANGIGETVRDVETLTQLMCHGVADA